MMKRGRAYMPKIKTMWAEYQLKISIKQTNYQRDRKKAHVCFRRSRAVSNREKETYAMRI